VSVVYLQEGGPLGMAVGQDTQGFAQAQGSKTIATASVIGAGTAVPEQAIALLRAGGQEEVRL
jgi:hypothetical protein